MNKIFSRLLVLFAFMFLVPYVYASELTENLTLEEDSTDCYVIKSGSNVTIDLNGHNITCATSDAIYVENNATLTVKGTGVVQSTADEHAAVFNNGTTNLNGGTFTADDLVTGFNTLLNHGTMNIKSGVTVSQTNYVSTPLIENGYLDYQNNENERYGYIVDTGLNTPTIIINGGEFIGGKNSIYNEETAVLEINNGHFTESDEYTIVSWNIATIKNGTFDSPKGSNKTTLYIASHGENSFANGYFQINGGTFKGDYIIELESQDLDVATINIKDGVFAYNNAFVNSTGTRPTWNEVGTKSITGGIFSDNNVTPTDGYHLVDVGSDYTGDGVNDYLVTKAQLTPATNVNLTVGKTYTIDVEEDVIKYGTWTNTDATIASVENGVITARKKGTTTIKVSFAGDTKTYEVTVSRIQVEKPTVTGTYTYSGEQQTVTLNGYDEELMTASDPNGLLAGSYTTTVSLNDTTKYEWKDGTDTTLSLEWTISKAKVEVPTLKATQYNYTGETVNPLVDGYDETIMNATGDLSGVEIGEYNIVYTLKDNSNYEWKTGQEEYTLTWNISKGKLTKPKMNPSAYAYTGDLITPILKDYDESLMTLSGFTFGGPVGKYKLKVSLKNKEIYTWADGTTDDFELNWTITFGVPEVKATSTYNSVKLTWTEVTGADGYQVYSCNSKGASCKNLGTTKGLSFTNKKLKFDKKYYYKVRAYRLDDESKIYGKFSELLTKKTALTKTTVTASTNRYRNVLVEWKKVAGATRYYVYRCDEEGKNCKNLGFAYDTDFINKTAKEGVKYTYKVRAYRSGIYGPYSTLVNGERLDDTISYSIKNTAFKTNKLTIKNVETATKYYIYRATSKNGTYKKIKTLNSTGNALTYEDKDVGFNKKYYYKVKITNGVNDSDFSGIKSIKTNQIAAPTFELEIEGKYASISINKVSGATGYQIMYSTDGETFTTLTKTTELSYAKRFDEDGMYYVKVRAYRKVGSNYFYSKYTAVEELLVATEKSNRNGC